MGHGCLQEQESKGQRTKSGSLFGSNREEAVGERPLFQPINKSTSSLRRKACRERSSPALGLVNKNGTKDSWLDPAQADLRDQIGGNFTVSADGQRVRFTIGHRNSEPVLFNLENMTLSDAKDPIPELSAPISDGLDIRNWRDNNLRAWTESIKIEANEVSRSLAIQSKAEMFVLGAEWHIRGYYANGNVAWEKSAPNTTYGVNIPPKKDVVIAAFADGTIRWLRLRDGKELVSLFVDAKDRRFVVWTPERGVITMRRLELKTL